MPVAADQQPLTGIVLAGDAGQIGRVEQPRLDQVLVCQLADHFAAQGRNPVEAGRLEVGLDAGLGEHTAVAHLRHALQAEALAERLHACLKRVRLHVRR